MAGLTSGLGASGRVVAASSLPASPVLLLGRWEAALMLPSRGIVAAVRGEQESMSHNFWNTSLRFSSTSKIPEDNPALAVLSPATALARGACEVGYLCPSTARLLSAVPHGMHLATSHSPRFLRPVSHFELFLSCVLPLQVALGCLTHGEHPPSPGQAAQAAAGSLPGCPSTPEWDSGRSC